MDHLPDGPGSDFYTDATIWRGVLSAPHHQVRLLNNVRMAMRDGVELSASVYLPEGEGRWPVLLQRSPYGASALFESSYFGVQPALYFASRGYAVVLQDPRGRFDSDGEWYPGGTVEREDGRDSVDWCGTQSWSNGHVGMYGMSYGGDVQWWAAAGGSSHLKTIVPFSALADPYRDGMHYRGGAFKLSGNLTWSLLTAGRTQQATVFSIFPDDPPSYYGSRGEEYLSHLPILTADEAAGGQAIDVYRDWVQHSQYDDYWKQTSLFGAHRRIAIPILQIAGWFDIHSVSAIQHVEAIQAEGTAELRKHHKLVMGPWIHGEPQRELGDLDLGRASVIDMRELQLRWFDHWLKGVENGADTEPTLKFFTLGANRWRTAALWPLPETLWTRLYLHSTGRAGLSNDDGALTAHQPSAAEASDAYTYDPNDPVPTLAPDPWSDPPRDYGTVGHREDVLVYSTERLSEDLEITGPVQAHIYASSSARDTDWTVRLLDVHPDGRSITICDGILRARFREPAALRTGVPVEGQYESPELLDPGRVYEFTIEVGVTSVVFKTGHRVRIQISSSNFPRFDRNLNNGGGLGVDPRIVVATQTIYHDPEHPSCIELPVIPVSGA